MTINTLLVALGDKQAIDFTTLANAFDHEKAATAFGLAEAIAMLSSDDFAPSYMIIDIGERGADVFAELDELASHCEATIQVAVTGMTNDILFYRNLKDRGVIEYFTPPIAAENVVAIFNNIQPAKAKKPAMHSDDKNGQVITVTSTASADGGTTLAMNLAYCLAHQCHKSTVLIDMDYQYGLVAKSLNLKAPYGTREIFEYPERGLDNTLVDKMLVRYTDNLHIIASPSDLRYMPNIQPVQIQNLVALLRRRFDCVIIDTPHIWANWTAALHKEADRVVIVSQLWLRSLTHTTRFLAALQSASIKRDMVALVINRSGAKFKEAITSKEFERVSHQPIVVHIPNDIKSIVGAEELGKTLFEVQGTESLRKPIEELAAKIVPDATFHERTESKNPLFSWFSKSA